MAKYCDINAQNVCTTCGKQVNGPTVKRVCKAGLGDRVAQGLGAFGITEERITKLIGRPCNCSKRRAALNKFGERFTK